ncbi:MAG TPA: ABC transporter permease [Puia sp.]|nr:ABC transporter permease [Puia sp.]
MLRNYVKTALRSLRASKAHSLINIIGLSIGMSVALLIGLWIWDEISFDKSNTHSDRIAQVMGNATMNGTVNTFPTDPVPLADVLRQDYGSYFKYVVRSSWNELHILSTPGKSVSAAGTFFEPKGPDLLDLDMRSGARDALKDPKAVLLSSSLATTFFGNTNPIGQLITMDGNTAMHVAGVYADLPANSSFADVKYIMPWDLEVALNPWIREMQNPWGNYSFRLYARIADNADMDQVSAKIKSTVFDHVREKRFKNEVFLHPMNKWHLYSDFKNGAIAGGRIQFVWLFGIIGLFVLLLACINFMNLSTARSDRRAKEVGIRKAIGSLRSQLIGQFYSESLVVAFFSFILSIGLVQLSLPFFNQIADKKMAIPWTNPFFWLTGIGFTLFTGIIAGSYPALYLSSFKPVKVLKGSFKAGRFASVPRKVLVIIQFAVSVVLAIGTIVVYRQIQFAKDRPIGYDRTQLISIQRLAPGIHEHFDAVRSTLLKEGAVTQMTESSSPLTDNWSSNGGIEWRGKDPNQAVDFPNTSVSYDYGKTVGWQFAAGRDFSRDFAGDSSAFIINEAAAKFMGLLNPVGEIIRWDDHPFLVIGVIKDVIAESPFEPVRPTLYHLHPGSSSFDFFRLNPAISTSSALAKIQAVYKAYSPLQPFDYKFADEEYAKKFGDQQRTGRIATAFSILAIFISCLGLFAMATFIAEQRIREIGVRKVLGATVFNLWSLLSREFVALVTIALLIATPVAWYFMNTWLLNYPYHTTLPWWIFATAGAAAILITLTTISYQSIKAALTNPIKSLRNE